MNWSVIAAAIAILALLLLLLKLFSGHGGKMARLLYQKHSALFSPDDRVFFRALKQAVGDEYEIFGKIRVADVVLPKKGASRKDSRLAFNPIAGRHFDFVLCDRDNLTIACAIQLFDKTNPERHGEPTDDPLKPICENVGLPLVRFQIKAEYTAQELQEKLRKTMVKEPFYLIETGGRKEPRISDIEI